MLTDLRRYSGRLLSQWVELWRRLEGPELEPPVWHSHYLSHRVSVTHLSELGDEIRGLVIDIGAGTGHGARYLNQSHSDYFPTDLPSGRDASDPGISKQGLSPIFHCSVYDLPFPDGHFGGAMMLSVLEHLEKPNQGLNEIIRVLKPGGYFLISTPFAFPVHGAPWDYRRWTLAGLTKELEETGFEIARAVNCGGGVAALAMNFHLLLRHHLLSDSYIGQKLIAAFLPLILVMQAAINSLAVLLDRFDRSGAFPLAIAVLARKPTMDTPCAA